MAGQVNFVDTSLRDGHQSLLATRMSTDQCMRVLPMLKDSGYTNMELWGGATLDSCLRFTRDDPFERLHKFSEFLGEGVQVRSLCRGQNLFGYSPYPDNVVIEFLKKACRLGNNRVRIFDALNDARNLQTATMAAKTFNAHAEAAMSYTVSPVHDTDHFIRFAHEVMDNGADSLAIKDMAGLLHPTDAWELFKALKKEFPGIELTLHSHCTCGLGVANYIVGILAGVDNYDTGHGPMAGGTAQPPVELIYQAAKIIGAQTNITMDLQEKIDTELRTIRKEINEKFNCDKDPDHLGGPWPKDGEWPAELTKKLETAIELLRDCANDRDKAEKAFEILEDDIMVSFHYKQRDAEQLKAQIPGGMLSNLHKQLKDSNDLESLDKVLAEVPNVRKAAGYVPLVTPTSQIVGTQATFNVKTGKPYSFRSKEFENLILGKYGRTPGPIDKEVFKLCSPDGHAFTERPANYAPEVDLEQVYKENGDLMTPETRETDLLLLLLFPGPAKEFMQHRKDNA